MAAKILTIIGVLFFILGLSVIIYNENVIIATKLLIGSLILFTLTIIILLISKKQRDGWL